MSDRSDPVLVVDDDQALLDALSRRHRKTHDLRTAAGAEEGLEKIVSEGPFAVVVSDYQMPGMNGVAFLSRVQELTPDTVRIMLTGNADLNAAVEAVNRGNIFRFLTKPCVDDVFMSSLDAGLEQHRLVHAERLLLEETVRGSVQVLADVLALSNPLAFGRATRVQSYVRHIVNQLQLEETWQYETAALLSQIGCVAIPLDVIERSAAGDVLSPDQQAMIQRHPGVARDLLAKIPRLESVSEMIAHQHYRNMPKEERESGIPMGSRILAVALDFDDRVSRGISRRQALAEMAKLEIAEDLSILKALCDVSLPGQSFVCGSLPVERLMMGMILDQDVRNENGSLVVARGHEITRGMLERLRNYAELGEVAGSIRVRMATAQCEVAASTKS